MSLYSFFFKDTALSQCNLDYLSERNVEIMKHDISSK